LKGRENGNEKCEDGNYNYNFAGRCVGRLTN